MNKCANPLPESVTSFLLFWAFFGVLPVRSVAQAPEIHCGITALPSLKIPVSGKGSLWGNVAICLTTIVEAPEENTLSFSLKTGFAYDATRYKTPEGGFLVDRANVFLNPEILFPTASPKLKIAGGFGVEFNGYFLAQTSGGNITPEDGRKVKDARRKALPFLSAGLQYDLKHSFFLHLFLKQMLMDAFRGDVDVSFEGASGKPLKLNQAPLYSGIGFVYFF